MRVVHSCDFHLEKKTNLLHFLLDLLRAHEICAKDQQFAWINSQEIDG